MTRLPDMTGITKNTARGLFRLISWRSDIFGYKIKAMELRIGHLSTFYHTAILLMAGFPEGTLDDVRKDTQITWTLFGTGPAIVSAFKDNLIDIAYIGLPPAIIGIEQGASIKCIAGGHIEGTVIAGEKGLKAYPELPGLDDVLGQLRGKTIGVPGKGSIHDVILADALERFDLQHSVTVINYKWADEITEAMAKGKVQAAAGTPALAVSVKRFAGGKVLYPPYLIWPANPSYGIVADTKFVNARPFLIGPFLKAHEEASAMLRERPSECAARIASYTGIVDEEFILDTILMSPKYCAQLTEGYIGSTMKFVTALKKLGYIKREPSKDEIFETGFISRAHPPGDHYGQAAIP